MLHKFQKRLAWKIGLPMIAVFIFLGLGESLLLRTMLNDEFTTELKSFTKLATDTSQFALETTNSAGNIQRYIAALGAQYEFDDILVVSGKPLRVIAAVNRSNIDIALSEYENANVIDIIKDHHFSRKQAFSLYEPSGSEWFVDVTAPLNLNNLSIGNRPVGNATLYFRLNITSANQSRERLVMAIDFVLAILAASVIYIFLYLLRKKINLPIAHINAIISERQEGNLSFCDLTTDDELGRLAVMFNRLLKSKDEVDRVKGEFVSTVSHELRTPMNAVLGMLQLMQHTVLNARQKDYATKAESSAKALLYLLNDILDFSKIDADKLTLDPHPFTLEQLLENLSVILAANHKRSEVEIFFSVDPSIPKVLIFDRFRLQQILTNLAGNAQKFTIEGHVSIRIELLSSTAQEAALRFSVIDTGIGITNEQKQHIFSGFTQAEASTTRRYGGTGLGLVISQRLVKIMGGELCLHSELGHGSRFWFDLLLGVKDPTPYINVCNIEQINNRIIILKENESCADILTQTLLDLCFQVTSVTAIDKAIEAFDRSFIDEKPYSVLLLDWQTYTRHDRTAARLLMSYAETHNLPVIILATVKECEALEFKRNRDERYSTLLAKPATPHQLASAIQKSLSDVPVSFDSVAAFGVQNRPLSGISILVVEDNEINRQVASELLEEKGATVSVAKGGLEGVELALAEPVAFHVVLMDIQMPDIDGYEATKRIRLTLDAKTLPIIAMTANAASSDKETSMAAGMNGHLSKPIDMTEVVNMVLQNVTYDMKTKGGSSGM